MAIGRPVLHLISKDTVWCNFISVEMAGIAETRQFDLVDRDDISDLILMIGHQKDQLLLIDKAYYLDIEQLKATLHSLNQIAPIAVAYSVPSWRDSVELRQAGASQYIEKSYDTCHQANPISQFIENYLLQKGKVEMRNRSKNILVVENEPLKITNIIRSLRQNGYFVDVIKDVEEARRALRKHWWHLAIVDLRLIDDNMIKDFSGLDLVVRDSDRIIKKLILTGFPDWPTTAQALENYPGELPPASAYLSKKDPAEQNVQRIIELIENRIGINWKLECDFDGPMTFLCMADWFMRQDDQEEISRDCTVEELSAELYDLWSMLFSKQSRVVIYSSPQGNGNTLLNRVKPYSDNVEPLIVVKTGLRQAISAENDRYDEYVDPGGSRNFSTQKKLCVQTLHFGAISYSLVGGHLAETERFADFYRAEDEVRINLALNHLFNKVCSTWYTGRADLSPIGIDEYYRQTMRLESPHKRDRLERRLKELATQAASLGFKAVTDETNPKFIFAENFSIDYKTLLRWIFETPSVIRDEDLLKTHPICHTHGDLNADNILVEQTGRAWLIDFARTGWGYRLRDFAELESVIAMDLRRQNDVHALVWFEKVIFGQQFWDQGLDLQSWNQDLVGVRDLTKALLVIKELRGITWQYERDNNELRRYYIALFFEAIFRLTIDAHDSPAQPSPLWRRMHALIRAATIIKLLAK